MGMSLALSSVRLDPLYNNIANLFGGAKFVAPLTHSVIPTSSASGTSATFTRATTATFTDNEGVLRTAIAGEARFEGARRVRNLLSTTSENFSNVVWSKTGSTSVTGTNVLNFPVAVEGVTQVLSPIPASGSKLVLSAKLSAPVAGTFSLRYYDGTSIFVQQFNLTTTPTEYSFALTTGAVGDARFYLFRDAADTATQVTCEYAQVEDVTAQTTQTAGEYVSVGVTSAPYYHGSMVDGVKCFPTDLSGNPLTTMERYKSELAETNSTIQSNSFATAPWGDVSGAIPISQNVIGPDGAVSAWTFNDNGVGGFMGRYQEYSLTSGTAAAFGIFVKKTTGVQMNYPAIVVSSPTHMSGACLHRTNGTAEAVTGFVGRTAIANTIVVEDFNTDYWRVKFTFTPNSTGAWGLYVMPAFNADGTGVGDNTITGTAVFYGMQGMVNGTMVGSYISTTTVAVTRNADVLTYTGGDIPNLKTLMAGFKREVGVSSTGAIAQLDDGTTNDFVITYLSSATAIRHQGTDGGAVQWNLPVTAVSTYVPGTACKSVQTWTTNDVKAAVNGATLTGDTAATVPTVTQLTVGHLLGTWQLDGNVGGIYGWTRNLSQSELNAVTA